MSVKNERGPHPDSAPRGPDEGLSWFPADVEIEDTRTGKTRTYAMWQALHDGEFSDFVWTEGNFACDCNRFLFFQYANGLGVDEVDDEDGPCGDGRYLILSLVDADSGRVLYSEAHR